LRFLFFSRKKDEKNRTFENFRLTKTYFKIEKKYS